MDTMHPAIVRAMKQDENVAHCGDSALYVRLAMCVMDINERCQAIRADVDRLGLIVSKAMLDIDMHVEAQRITADQRDRLVHLLTEGLEEPTAENDVPVYAIKFPAPYEHRPRPA